MKTEDLKELEKENLEKLIIFASRGIKKKINKLIEVNKYNVTLEEYLTIVNILNFKGIYQSELAQRIDKDRHATSRIVDTLIKKDLIYKESDLNDARKFKIYPTDLCRKSIIPKDFDKQLSECVFANIDSQKLQELKSTIIEIINNVTTEFNDEE